MLLAAAIVSMLSYCIARRRQDTYSKLAITHPHIHIKFPIYYITKLQCPVYVPIVLTALPNDQLRQALV